MERKAVFLQPEALTNARKTFYLEEVEISSPKRSSFIKSITDFQRPAKWKKQGAFIRIWAKGSVPFEAIVAPTEFSILENPIPEDSDPDEESTIVGVLQVTVPYTDFRIKGRWTFPNWYLLGEYLEDLF